VLLRVHCCLLFLIKKVLLNDEDFETNCFDVYFSFLCIKLTLPIKPVSPLLLAADELTPYVEFDKKREIFHIEGKSLLDNPNPFFAPLKDWLIKYSNEPNSNTVLDVKFEYFNIATSREFLDLIKILETIPSSKVIWQFSEDDEDMEELGQELAELVSVPFEFHAY